MKRMRIAAAVLAAALLTACSGGKTGWVKTMAVPLEEGQLKGLGFEEAMGTYLGGSACGYRGADGTRTIYLYSAHAEETGEWTATERGWTHSGRYAEEILPAVWNSETSMLVSGGGQTLQVFPGDDGEIQGKAEERTNAFGQNRSCVVYADAFGKGIDYVCTPTAYGLNTEIVLRKRPEAGRFELRVRLPELYPDTQSPDYIAFREGKEDGPVKSILYTPMAVDKKEAWSYANALRLTDKDAATNTYRVTYTVDEAFLEKAAYPVRLNASLHLYKAKQPDTSAYSDTGDTAGHYLSPYMLMGDSTSKGEGWTYVRYETLDKIAADPDEVLSARYIFRNLLDLPESMTVGAYAVTADWCSINTRWYNRPPYDEQPMSRAEVKKKGDYALDVTRLVKLMLENKGKENAVYSVNNSFMIRSDTPERSALFASGDGGLFSPVLELVLKE